MNPRLFTASLILSVSGVCLWGPGAALAEQFDIITRTTTATGVQVRIDRPNPKQHETDYPSITFMPGDAVTVNAGGCVQSGGLGNTWHRYVNPSGGKADRLYKGLITIPYATGVLEPIADYVGKTVQVSPGAPPNQHLQLGFEDDDYSDNGYYSHDNGPNDQCKGADGGPAWVVLNIQHNATVTTSSSGGPWDLVYAAFDENGIPLEPDWRSNVQAHTLPDPGACTWPWNGSTPPVCTTEIDDRDTMWVCQGFSENYGFGGHANWIAGTYTGAVAWEEKSSLIADDEYSINLSTPGAAGQTAGRREGVHVEFDSRETINTLSDDFKLPWWTLFHSAVDAGNTQAHALLDGKEMIVTGLIGVDFAHTPSGESHPAWDVAIHANDDPSDDTWAIFARNWGNEGFCSGDQHVIDYIGNRYTFSLPWPAGAVSGKVLPSSQFLADGSSTPSMSIAFVPGKEVQVTFFGFADPSAKQLIGGELHIQWTIPTRTPIPSARGAIGTTVERSATNAGRARAAVVAGRPPEEEDVAEASVDKAVNNLPAAQRVAYQTETRIPHAVVRVNVQIAPQVVRLAGRPRVRSVPDPQALQLKTEQLQALQKAYGGKIPGMK